MILRGPSLKANLFWPLAVLAVLAFGGVAAAGLWLVTAFDKAAREREQSVVANGIDGRVSEVAHMATGEVVWDAAVRNLGERFDIAWARQYIGTYFALNDGFADSFVVDAADTPIYAAHLNVFAAPVFRSCWTISGPGIPA